MPASVAARLAGLGSLLTQTEGFLYADPTELSSSPSLRSYHPPLHMAGSEQQFGSAELVPGTPDLIRFWPMGFGWVSNESMVEKRGGESPRMGLLYVRARRVANDQESRRQPPP